MLTYMNIVLATLLTVVISCTPYTENTGLDTSHEKLAAEFEAEELPGYLEAARAGEPAETELLPLEQREKIAHEQGISESDARIFQRELKLFARDLGFEERDLEFIDTPYFFVDGAGEVRDLDTYKGLLSYIMKQRVAYQKTEDQLNALFDEFQPRLEAVKEDSAETARLLDEYEERREEILNTES